MKEITSYSDFKSENEFFITENDISDLDVFFTYKLPDEKIRIIREPLFYFSVASHTQTEPIYQLGSNKIIGYSKGNSFVAGRVIINSFSNIPFGNLILGTGTLSGKPEDLPPVDLYIINKRNSMRKKIFQDIIIKNVKINSWNFEQGIETPGRYVIADYMASEFQGVHLRDYMVTNIYGRDSYDDLGLSVNETSTENYNPNIDLVLDDLIRRDDEGQAVIDTGPDRIIEDAINDQDQAEGGIGLNGRI